MPMKSLASPFRCGGCCEPRQPEDQVCPNCKGEGVYVALRVADASRPGSKVLGPRARKFEEAQMVVLDEKWRVRKQWPRILASVRRDWESSSGAERLPGITPVGVEPTPGHEGILLDEDWLHKVARRRRQAEKATRRPATGTASKAGASRRTRAFAKKSQ